MPRRPRKPDTEALQKAVDRALDQARDTGEIHYVLQEPYRLRFETRPQSQVISPLPGDLEARALAHPDGRIVYL